MCGCRARSPVFLADLEKAAIALNTRFDLTFALQIASDKDEANRGERGFYWGRLPGEIKG